MEHQLSLGLGSHYRGLRTTLAPIEVDDPPASSAVISSPVGAAAQETSASARSARRERRTAAPVFRRFGSRKKFP